MSRPVFCPLRDWRAHGVLSLAAALLAAAEGCGPPPPPVDPWAFTELPPAPPPRPRPPTPAPSASAAPEAPPPPPEPPPEPVPEHLGTPATSRAAAPKSTSEGYAPQPGYEDSLFRDADVGPDSTAEPGGVACSLTLAHGHEYDPFSSPDPEIHVSVSRGREQWRLFVGAALDTYETTFAIPLFGPQKGDRLTFDFIDEDLQFDDFIETTRTTLKGRGPFDVPGRLATLECRPYSRAVVEQHFDSQKKSVERSLSEMAALKPDFVDEHFGLGRQEDGGASATRWGIEGLAGLVGWDDPRVKSRLARLAEAEEGVKQSFSRAFDALQGHLPKMGSLVDAADGAVLSRVGFYECGRATAKKFGKWAADEAATSLRKHGCVLGLEVTNLTSTPMEIDAFRGNVGPWSSLRLVTRTGAVFSLEMVSVVLRGKTRKLDHFTARTLGPGATAVIYGVPVSRELSQAPSPPLLLRGFHGARVLEAPEEGGTLAGGALHLRAGGAACGEQAARILAAVTTTSSWSRPSSSACVMRARLTWLGNQHTFEIGRSLTWEKPLRHLYLVLSNGTSIQLDPYAVAGPDGYKELTDKVAVKTGGSVDVLWTSSQPPPAGASLTPYRVRGEFRASPTVLRVDPPAAPPP